MANSNNKLAVVTGASSGIGLELPKIFAKNGFNLLIAAEDDAINSVATQLNATAVQVDLSTEEGVEELYAKIKATGQPVDSICINAGIGHGKAFADQTKEQVFEMIDLNVRGTAYLAHLIVKDMVKQNSGHILFTASVVSTMPSPYQGVYAATKAFDLSLAEALRHELKDTNITVTALRPGATETNFFKRGGLMDTAVGVTKKDDPAKVAQDGYDALMANKHVVVGGSLKNKMMTIASDLLPDTETARQGSKLSKPGTASKVPPEKRAS